MATKRKKALSIGWMIILCLVAFGVAGAVTYFALKPAPPVVIRPKPAVVKPPAGVYKPAKPSPQTRDVTIYVPHAPQGVNGHFYLVPVIRKTTAAGDQINAAVQALLASSKESGEAGKLIPQGTRLLNPVTVQGDLAVINLSKEFINNFSGGSTEEALTLNSIVQTIVSSSGRRVHRVQILVEGKKADSLGGHFEITDPIEPDNDILRPGSSD